MGLEWREVLFCSSTLYLAQAHSSSDVVHIWALWLSSSVPETGTSQTPSLVRLQLQTCPSYNPWNRKSNWTELRDDFQTLKREDWLSLSPHLGKGNTRGCYSFKFTITFYSWLIIKQNSMYGMRLCQDWRSRMLCHLWMLWLWHYYYRSIR